MGHDQLGGQTPPQLNDLLAFLAEHPGAKGLAIEPNGLEWTRLPAVLARDLPPFRPGVDPQGTTTLDLMTDEDRRSAVAAFGRCWRSGFAECTIRPIGDAEPHALSMWDLRDEVGTVVAVVIPGREVESTQTAPRPRPRVLVHTASETGATLTVDAGTEVLLGWTADELVGDLRIDYVHPDDRADAIMAWVEMLEKPDGVSRRRCRYCHKTEKRWVWFEITTTNLLERFGHVRCELFDISDSMAAFDALYQREQLLRYLTESMPQGILHLSASGDVLFANDHLCEIAGQVAEPFELLQQISPEDRAKLTLAFSQAIDGTDADLEGSIARPDGSIRRCQARIRSLGSREAGVLVSIEDITDQWTERMRLAEQATTDPLTGLLNRRATLALLDQVQAEAGWSGMATSVAFLDLNGFKQVNDCHGHQIGDRVLTSIAESLRSAVRPDDGVGRLGGDEFLVICRNTNAQEAVALAARLRAAVTRTITVDGDQIEIGTSIGVASDRAGSRKVDELVDAADRNMYEEKQSSLTR